MSEPERYLLDTSTVIDLPSPAQITSDAEYLISSITLAELNAGIHAASNPQQRATRLARLQWVSDAFDPLPFTVGTARMYGQLVALILGWICSSPRSRHTTASFPRTVDNPADFADLSPLVTLIGLDGR